MSSSITTRLRDVSSARWLPLRAIMTAKERAATGELHEESCQLVALIERFIRQESLDGVHDRFHHKRRLDHDAITIRLQRRTVPMASRLRMLLTGPRTKRRFSMPVISARDTVCPSSHVSFQKPPARASHVSLTASSTSPQLHCESIQSTAGPSGSP